MNVKELSESPKKTVNTVSKKFCSKGGKRLQQRAARERGPSNAITSKFVVTIRYTPGNEHKKEEFELPKVTSRDVKPIKDNEAKKEIQAGAAKSKDFVTSLKDKSIKGCSFIGKRIYIPLRMLYLIG